MIIRRTRPPDKRREVFCLDQIIMNIHLLKQNKMGKRQEFYRSVHMKIQNFLNNFLFCCFHNQHFLNPESWILKCFSMFTSIYMTLVSLEIFSKFFQSKFVLKWNFWKFYCNSHKLLSPGLWVRIVSEPLLQTERWTNVNVDPVSIYFTRWVQSDGPGPTCSQVHLETKFWLRHWIKHVVVTLLFLKSCFSSSHKIKRWSYHS